MWKLNVCERYAMDRNANRNGRKENEMSKWDNYCDEIGGVCKDMEAQAARIAELEAENERLRKELNLIGTKADFCADECEYGPDATSFRSIADDANRALKRTETWKSGYAKA